MFITNVDLVHESFSQLVCVGHASFKERQCCLWLYQTSATDFLVVSRNWSRCFCENNVHSIQDCMGQPTRLRSSLHSTYHIVPEHTEEVRAIHDISWADMQASFESVGFDANQMTLFRGYNI